MSKFIPGPQTNPPPTYAKPPAPPSPPRKTRVSFDHVRLEEGGRVFTCNHCGDRYVMNLPILLTVYAAACKEYSKAHRHCKQRQAA